MGHIVRASILGDCGPDLNDEQDIRVWLDKEGSPKARASTKTNSSNSESSPWLLARLYGAL